MATPGEELAFINMDRMEDILRANMRKYRDGWIMDTGQPPDVEVMACAVLMVLRGPTTNAAALAAMMVGLRVLAAEVLAEALH